jgi:RNA polymerase sigma-70 factor, ECF subfamily
MSQVPALLDHLFRHSAGQMVATLTRVFGPEHLELAEEVVQEALIAAMQQWTLGGIPENPQGWLFKVARNRALDQLRRDATLRNKEPEVARVFAGGTSSAEDSPAFAHELRDDQLRMMLMCAHPAVPAESRIALILKTVGGFSVDEIARAFLTKKETIAQRIVRAKKLIREEHIPLELPSRAELPGRVETLLDVIYLMFNEGYSALARDVSDEAIRLGRALSEHPSTGGPAPDALLALMLLQAARFPARIDAAGELAILSEQDRASWDQQLLADGLRTLGRAGTGDRLTAYHVEAAIAAVYAASPSFEETDWRAIVAHYNVLLELKPSPVVALNRAVALAMAESPAAGIAAIESIAAHPSLRDYLPLFATLGELWLREGDSARAAEYFARALELPGSLTEKRFLLRKLTAARANPS